MNCVFCKIAVGEIPAEKIYENETELAFLDIHPRAPGHTVVIPRAHRETISDLPPEELRVFFGAVQKTVELLKNGLSPDGFTLGINHGRVAGQEVEHLHFHIVPRYKNDGGSSLQSVVNNKPAKSLREIAQAIKNN